MNVSERKKGGKTLTIQERLKKLRKNILNLSLEVFGEKIGVRKNAVSRWENGVNNIPESMIKAICREYNVNYFWLTEGDGDVFIDLPETALDELCLEYGLDEFERSIISEFIKLSDDERKVIKKYIDNIKKEH